MTDETEARVAPAATGPELTEHVNVLMTEETRALLLGSKVADRARSEGEVARSLLNMAITAYRETSPAEYGRRVALGRRELSKRRRQRERDQAAA